MAATLLVGPVVADTVADDGDLHVFLQDDEPIGNRFEELDSFLGGSRRGGLQSRIASALTLSRW